MSIFNPVDDKIMIRRNLFFAGAICITAILAGILTGCKSQPKPVALPPAPAPAAVEDDIWALLAKGETEKAKAFFMGKANVNDTDEQGRTPLHYAAENRDSFLAAFFIALGAEPDVLDKNQKTPLSISAEKLDAPTAGILAGKGANIHQSMNGGDSPARIAIRENGDFLEAILTPASLASVDPAGKTILHLAAEAGNARAANTILKAGADFSLRDKNGKSALDFALERADSKNHAETAEQLILAGAVSNNPLYAYFAPAAKSSNYNLRIADGMTPLHYIAREGYIGYLTFILERKADANLKNASGASPLHEAARSGNIRVMQTLIDYGAEVNAQDAKGNSVLHVAVPADSHLEAIKLFLSNGANINLRDEHGDSPLHIAILLNRSEEIIRTLLSKGADVTIRDIDGKTPLFLAVERSRGNYIPMLLEYGSDIFAVDNKGITPYERSFSENSSIVLLLVNDKTIFQNDSDGNTILHLTTRFVGNSYIINRILDHGASIDARNKAGDTSLAIAVRQNEEDAGLLLLSRGADIFAANAKGESPLYLAFPPKNGKNSELRQWMLNPQTLSARDGLGNTAFHYIAQWRFDAWVPVLVKMGANIEAANATGETPLFAAVKQDSPSTIKVLMDNGGSLFARDTLGNSLLHAAVRWHAIKGAETLLDKGLDINCHALNGKTPLHDAIRWWMPDMELLLLKRGADIEIRDTEGNTPFMEAVLAGNSPSMEQLFKRGADTKTRNFKGDTALHITASMDRTDLSAQLLAWGVSMYARNAQDRTPYQNAINNGSPRLISVFLTKDRLNSSDDFGSTPLHIAVQERASPSTIQTILELGARQSMVDAEGRTALRLAMDLGLLETAQLLANSGGDVFAAARDGKTPVEAALSKGADAVRALFSGAAINARDSSGNTPLHYAAKQGDASLVSLLISLGANKTVKNITAETPADIALRWRKHEAAALLN
jgi:ankyrin repeat protein